MVYFILCVSTAIIIDLKTLKKIKAELYSDILKEIQLLFKIVFIFALVALAVSEEKEFIVQAFYLFFLIPIYIIKRIKFINKIKNEWVINKPLSMISDACAVSVYWMFSIFSSIAILKIAGKIFPPFMTKIEIMMLASMVSSAVVLVAIYKASINFPGGGFLSKLGVRKPRFSNLKIVLMPVILGLFFSFASALLMVTREMQPETPFGDMMENVTNTSGVFLFLAAAMLTAPFVEEIIFRGYFFYVLKKIKGRVFAVVTIAAVFSFMHIDQYWGDGEAILMVTLLGLVMTLLRAFSGSVIPSIIMHYIYNSGVLIFSIILTLYQNPSYFEYISNADRYSVKQNIQLLKKSITKNPKFTDAYNELAVIYAANKNKLNDALYTINKALFYHPERAVYLDTKAMILMRLNRVSEALEIQDKLKKINPRYKIGSYQTKSKNIE